MFHVSDNISNMIKHIKKCGLAREENVEECTFCKKKFKTKQKLNSHLQTHMKTRKTEYDCEQCDKSFPENWLLKRHMKNSHENKTVQIGNNFGIFAENTGNYETKDILYCD